MHLNNGWWGMGYHFNIRKNGTVELGTPLETVELTLMSIIQYHWHSCSWQF